jgi:hypothetical protein
MRVGGLGSRVERLGSLGLGGLEAWGLGLRAWGLGLRGWGLGLRVASVPGGTPFHIGYTYQLAYARRAVSAAHPTRIRCCHESRGPKPKP